MWSSWIPPHLCSFSPRPSSPSPCTILVGPGFRHFSFHSVPLSRLITASSPPQSISSAFHRQRNCLQVSLSAPSPLHRGMQCFLPLSVKSLPHLIFLHLTLLSAAAAAKPFQSHPTLCDPRDGSPPGSPVPGILQARTLEWVAISFSNAWKWKVKVKALSQVQLLETPWTAAYQAPPSMGFSRQEYWSGLPLPSPNTSL